MKDNLHRETKRLAEIDDRFMEMFNLESTDNVEVMVKKDDNNLMVLKVTPKDKPSQVYRDQAFIEEFRNLRDEYSEINQAYQDEDLWNL